jgi:glycosyltransferase involved in cell wall biosynthesis
VNLLFTGTLGNVRGRDDRGLFAALRELARDDPTFSHRLRLVIAGSMTEEAQAVISQPELAPMVRHLGVLSRPEALALQRRAAALLLITSADDASVASMKIYEYVAAGRPILALAGDNQAARIVEETGTGVRVAPDDVPGIRRALERLVSGAFAKDYAPHDRSPHTYPAPAETLAAIIDDAVARRKHRDERN